MLASIYIESSVISYLTAKMSRDITIASRQSITLEWWEQHRKNYEIYISALVIEEISAGNKIAALARLQSVANVPSVTIEPSAELLAHALLTANAVPMNSFRDALHIAIAATQGIDFLLTWNFKHINNAETRNLIIDVIAKHGWTCPILCSPEELGGINNV